MQKISIFSSILLTPVLMLVFGQGCSRGVEFSQAFEASSRLEATSGNGTSYDGKFRILHHYVDNFICEGRPQPESILIRDNDTDWYLIRNTSAKCAAVDRLPVAGVQYDETANQAHYEGDLYVPPHPYFVNATENPNLPDVRLEDGVCEDINGVCSLKASIDQAGTTSATEAVLVHVPAGTYGLTGSLVLSSNYANSKAVTIRGAGPLTTILDGANSVTPLTIKMVTTAPVSIENITIQNGKTSNSLGSSAIYLSRYLGMSHLDVTNCIFKNNKTGAAINAGPGSGNIRIRKSQFIGNQATAIEVFAVTSLLVEDTTIANNNGHGIYVNNETSNVVIRSSTISNNALIGIAFHRCSSCLIENVTVTQNQQDGVRIYAFSANPNYDMTINSSTFFGNGNGFSWAGNIKLEFFDATNKLLLNNSILAMNNVSKPNCLWNAGNPDSHRLVATNSIIDDSACEQTGSGNIIANPMLGPLTNNGGVTLTMLPLAGSPAIDAGANNLCSSEDQRSLPRPIDKLGAGPRCDIGAVELQ